MMEQQPISISTFLFNHQTLCKLDTRITHGKGRKGVIIRTRPKSRLSRIKNAFSRGQK